MKRDFEYTGGKCETCREDLKNGAPALSLEDSTIGASGFVPLPDRCDLVLFCSEQCFADYSIDDDLRSYQGCRPASHVDAGEDARKILCDHCGTALELGMRALRVQDSNMDGLGFVPLKNRHDWSFFCSKKCAEDFMTAADRMSFPDYWEDLKRKLDRQEGRRSDLGGRLRQHEGLGESES